MKDYIKMVTVLTSIAAVCGLLLAAVEKGTETRREEQLLINVKIPAVERILESSTNKFIDDRQKLMIDEQEMEVFVGKKEDAVWGIAIENTGTGFGGNIGVMVGFDLESDKLTGIGIVSHKETPGLGARVTEPTFSQNFKGRSLNEIFMVRQDGGTIDAVSGATISSRAVCDAVRRSVEMYPKIKKMIREKEGNR